MSNLTQICRVGPCSAKPLVPNVRDIANNDPMTLEYQRGYITLQKAATPPRHGTVYRFTIGNCQPRIKNPDGPAVAGRTEASEVPTG